MSGISHVPSPDVWGDPLSAEEFENSFLESLNYYWSKEFSRETTNYVAQTISNSLSLFEKDKAELDEQQLKKLIQEWLVKNTESNIFDLLN